MNNLEMLTRTKYEKILNLNIFTFLNMFYINFPDKRNINKKKQNKK
jgi:hypothetical protein